MDEFYKWVYTIVVIIIFVTFVDILMPSSSMKKYTKLILGFLVMSIILNPVLRFLKKDFDITGMSFKFENQLETSSIKKQSEDYSSRQLQETSKLYKQNLEQSMEDQIKKAMGLKNVRISADVVDDTKAENFGEIKKIIVYISGQIKPVDKVEKIDLGKDEKDTKASTSSGIQDIRKKVAALFNIDIEKVDVIKE